MKKCAYCGRENPDDATHCSGCGTNGFICWEETAPKGPKHIFFRVSIAACMGLAISVLALFVSWLNTRDAEGLRLQQSQTQHTLRYLDAQIVNYQKQFGAPPRELEEFDGWGRPFVYWTDGTNYLCTSYGRDGKPGGKGLDRDLTNRERKPVGYLPTFHQFLLDCPSTGIIVTCLFSGFLAFLLGAFTLKPPELTRGGLAGMFLNILATSAGALIIAIFLAAAHIPTGH